MRKRIYCRVNESAKKEYSQDAKVLNFFYTIEINQHSKRLIKTKIYHLS